MLRLSRMTDYGVVLLSRLGEHEPTSVKALARETGVPPPSAAQILRRLVQGGLVLSRQGAQGGYLLARSPRAITLAQIIGALEGPIALTACVDESEQDCGSAGLCPVHGWWDEANRAVVSALSGLTLADVKQRTALPFAPPPAPAPAPAASAPAPAREAP